MNFAKCLSALFHRATPGRCFILIRVLLRISFMKNRHFLRSSCLSSRKKMVNNSFFEKTKGKKEANLFIQVLLKSPILLLQGYVWEYLLRFCKMKVSG